MIYLSKLDNDGFSFKFGNKCFSLFKESHLIGSGILTNGLYKINLDNNFVETLLTVHHNVGDKRNLIYDNSSFLWHRRLGHILVKE